MEKEVSNQKNFNALCNDLLYVMNKHIKESKDLEIRDFLACISIIFVDTVRMSELVDPENYELNRFRAIEYLRQLVFNDSFRNYKRDVFH